MLSYPFLSHACCFEAGKKQASSWLQLHIPPERPAEVAWLALEQRPNETLTNTERALHQDGRR